MDPSLEKAEDLLTEATALVERAKIVIPDQPDPVVFGFRQNGAVSLFFGPEIAYHFNKYNQLRRVFMLGVRYKAAEGQLVRIDRVPNVPNVRLQITPVKPAQVETIFSLLDHQLSRIKTRLGAAKYRLIGQVSLNGKIVERLQDCIPELLHHRIADSPHVDAS